MTTNFNFACDEPWPTQTLAQLRSRMMVRLGYAAQKNDPPPGMRDEIDDALQEAQRLAWVDFSEMHQTRYFAWTLAPGDRFVSLSANVDACSKKITALDIEYAAVRIVGTDAWIPLRRGIDPRLYEGGVQNSYPTRYDVRQGIEVWPAPADTSELMLRGRFGILPFTADGDITTIDADALFLRALGVLKAHRRQPDANGYIQQYQVHVGNLVAAQHGDTRYIPSDGDTCRVDGLLTATFDGQYDLIDGSIMVVGENTYLGLNP